MPATKTLKARVRLAAPPQAVYKALLSSKEHSAIIGSKATASARVGGKTSAWGGYLAAKNLRLVPGKRIVQAWRGSDWDKGLWSKATFVFKAVKGGSVLSFSHSGVPADFAAQIRDGWKRYYWTRMQRYFAKMAKKGTYDGL
jgi:uncharacterized protein YndB with AHSA1/START domain